MTRNLVPTAWNWAKIITSFGSMEILSKGLMFLTGILIVRHMDKTEYAWYTIVNSMMGGLTMLSMLGVGSGVLAMGGKHFHDRQAMGRLMSTARKYRLIFAAMTAPIVIGVMINLLQRNDCPPTYIAALVAIVLAMLAVQINQSLANQILGLARRYIVNQSVNLGIAVVRLAGVALFLTLFAVQAYHVLAWTVLVTFLGYRFFLRPRMESYYDPAQKPHPQFAKSFRNIALNNFPNSLSAFFMPQITLFLIAIFGSTGAVADLGAISRLGLLFAVPKALNKGIFSPILARVGGGNPRLFQRFLIVVAFSGSIAGAAYAGIRIFADPLLQILGPNYGHLQNELVFFAAISATGYFADSLNTITHAKAWIRYAWLRPVGLILAQLMTIPFIDLSSILGVLKLNLVGVLFGMAWTLLLILRGFAGKGSVLAASGDEENSPDGR